MTRKHFDQAARIFNFFAHDHQADQQTVARLAYQFAHMFAEANPNFDRERFFAACEVNLDLVFKGAD